MICDYIYFSIYKLIYIAVLLSYTYGTSFITGEVIDEKNNPIAFANVYIKDSFDGTSTDAKGEFSFETFETGEQVIIVSFVGFEKFVL